MAVDRMPLGTCRNVIMTMIRVFASPILWSFQGACATALDHMVHTGRIEVRVRRPHWTIETSDRTDRSVVERCRGDRRVTPSGSDADKLHLAGHCGRARSGHFPDNAAVATGDRT